MITAVITVIVGVWPDFFLSIIERIK